MMRLVSEKLFILLWRAPSRALSPLWRALYLTARPQDISMSPNRVDQLLGVGIVDLAPQSGNIDLDDVAEFFPVIVIEVLEQFCLRDHSARAMPQIFEDAIFHGSQRDFPVSPADGSCHCVQLKIADGNHRGVLSSASPDQCFGAREKLTQIKG